MIKIKVTQKLFNQVVGLLFAVKTVFIVYYLLTGMPISVGTWQIQTWLLVIAVIVDAYIAYTAFTLKPKK